MALTVGDLLKTPGLALNPLAGKAGLSNRIRWVHVSELRDPTPWLKGGELLLTTGMGVGRSAPAQRSYIQRLIDARLAGLGFGLGFSFQKVPKAIIDAAERGAFPVFEVPYPVPFIAITETVSTRLAADQYELLSRSLEAEHALTRTVLEGKGAEGVISSLSRTTGGWTLLVDLHGSTLAAAPRAAASRGARVWSELQSRRGEGAPFSLSLVEGEQHVSIQPVSAQGRVEAFLAVGKREALTQFDRIVSSHALSLLALEMAKARAVSETERRLKGDVLDQLLVGTMGDTDSRRSLERFGFDLAEPVAVVVLSASESPAHLARACEEVLAERTGAFLVSVLNDDVVAVFQPADPGFLTDLRASVGQRTNGKVLVGAGSPVAPHAIPQGLREARFALQVCRTEGREEADFGDLGTYQLLLSLQDPDALRAFAASVLGPLDEYDRRNGGELIASLQAFLDHNARWEEAAAKLFVHRHTLRYRMRRVQELTGRRLSSARDRMEFFLALRARDVLASEDLARDPALSSPYKGDARVFPPAATRGRRKG